MGQEGAPCSQSAAMRSLCIRRATHDKKKSIDDSFHKACSGVLHATSETAKTLSVGLKQGALHRVSKAT